MKQIYPTRKQKQIISVKYAVLAIAFLSITLSSFSQKLVFRNPVLVSGVDKADGAVYRFSNVSPTLDALVKIIGRSSCDVTLDTVDVTSTGSDRAFQPFVSYKHGTASGSANWWMEFNITFVRLGTSTPTALDTIKGTSYDIDGDDALLQDQFVSFNPLKCNMYNPTKLSMSESQTQSQITGSKKCYPGIDTAAKDVMVDQYYLGASAVRFRYGANVSGGCMTQSITGRYNSIAFEVISKLGNTLPMTIVAFDAQLNNNKEKALLNWSTATELNASNFVVQRSTNGTDYEDVALVFTQEGNSSTIRNYNYADDISSVNSNIVYYRLKLVDLDGNFSYSPVDLIRLTNESKQAEIVTFPNPVQNQLHITIPNSWQGKLVSYTIYNVSGSPIKQIANSNAGQTETVDISTLPMGVYFVKAANGSQTSVQRIIKTNN
ncbi:MAG: T9SS type A sorting domain-containing protein [Bacteroidetes bacterium]|nr:T9SS type A sorting domain-containing protein [Bacteroidota bacterium]